MAVHKKIQIYNISENSRKFLFKHYKYDNTVVSHQNFYEYDGDLLE